MSDTELLDALLKSNREAIKEIEKYGEEIGVEVMPQALLAQKELAQNEINWIEQKRGGYSNQG